jgi:hypothetical protein
LHFASRIHMYLFKTNLFSHDPGRRLKRSLDKYPFNLEWVEGSWSSYMLLVLPA